MAGEITWSAKTYCDCGGSNWFFFDEEKTKTSTSGTSANSFTIYINKAISPNDCSNGYVGVSSTTIDGEIEETIIPVNRCLPSCECGEDIKFSSNVKPLDDPYPISEQTNVEIGSWVGDCNTSLIGVITGGTIFKNVNINTSGKTITATIKENTTFDERYDFFRFTLNGKTCYSGSISQEAKPYPCFSSTDISITPTSVTDDTCKSFEIDYSLVGDTDCWFVKKAKFENNIGTINIDESIIYVTKNPSSEQRTDICTLTLQNGATGSEINKTINITQAGCEEPAQCGDVTFTGDTDECALCDCTSGDLILSDTSFNLESTSFSGIIATVGNCIKTIGISAKTGEELWPGMDLNPVSASTSTHNVYLIVPENPGGLRSDKFDIVYDDYCNNEWSTEIEITQEAGVICPDYDEVVGATMDKTVPGCASSWAGHLEFKTGGTSTTRFTSLDSIVGDGTVIVGGFFDADTVPGYRMVIIISSENPSTSESRSGSMTITMNTESGGKCSYEVPITQQKRDASYCQTLSSATIRYTNNTGVQIQDGIGYLYDSSGNEIGAFRIDSTPVGNYWEQPVGGESLGKTVAKVIAKMHLEGSGSDLVCRNCIGTGTDIIGETLEANHTYTVDIGNNVC